MSQFDKKIFKGKKYSDILEEIYNNQKKKEAQINALIAELKPLIEDVGDATLVVPLIKEYMDLGVKNDDLLVKMAVLVQKSLVTTSTEDSMGITEEEKQQLLDNLNKLKGDTK
jgi:hypothetical protein